MGRGALAGVARRNDIPRLQELLSERKSRCDNAKGNEYKAVNNALLAAVEKDHLEAVQCLVEEGAAEADFWKWKLQVGESSIRRGKTPLELACYYGHWEVAKYLASKIEPDNLEEAQSRLLKTNTNRRFLVELWGAEIISNDSPDKYGYPLLMELIGDGLLDANTQVNWQRRRTMSLLHFACGVGRTKSKACEFVTFLLRNGANPNTKCSTGETPLALCCSCQNYQSGNPCCTEAIVTLLIHGANPNATDQRGYTPLMLLLEWHREGNSEDWDAKFHVAVYLLVGLGANPNATSKDVNSPLKLAVAQAIHRASDPSPGSLEILDTLLTQGASVATREGCDALALAAYDGIVRYSFVERITGFNLVFVLLHAFVGETGGLQ